MATAEELTTLVDMLEERLKGSGILHEGPANLYSDIVPTSGAEQAVLSAERSRVLQASLRGDMAGSPAMVNAHPGTYQQKVMRVWEAYSQDAFFQRMIDRCVDFSAQGSAFEVPSPADDESWMKKIRNYFTRKEQKAEREEEFWEAWDQNLNRGVPGVIPGLETVIRWAVKHILLSGMFVPHWEWGEFKPRGSKQTYLVPTAMTCYPASAITLSRPMDVMFRGEKIYYRNPQISMSGMPFIEGYPMETTGTPMVGNSQPGHVPIPVVGTLEPFPGWTEGMALKYQWSPGDLVTIRRSSSVQTGQLIYPNPPFFSLHPQFIIRQRLMASDLAILDGVINYIMLWKIGDKDHPPVGPKKNAAGQVVEDGTVAQVRKLIREGRVGPALEMFVPYYVDLVIKTPDTGVLLSDVKYVQSTVEIFQAFGIFFGRNNAGSRERMEKINITMFEEMMNTVRWHVAAFVYTLANRIEQVNPGKFSNSPRFFMRPLNTKSDQFLANLFELRKLGQMSLRTMLEYNNLGPEVELRRLATEEGTDVNELTQAAVPLTNKQLAGPGGTTLQPTTNRGGRPRNPGTPAKSPRIPGSPNPGGPKRDD